MGLFSDRREYKAAQEAQAKLQRSQKRRKIREETPSYLKANKRTNAAVNKLPWWARI
jgi:hypothetical protein